MIETILDAPANVFRHLLHQSRAEIALDDIPAQGQRQTRDAEPPLAEVENFMETQFTVRELAFVNEQTGVVFPFPNLVEDLVERYDMVLNLRFEETQGEEGRRDLQKVD